MRIALLEDEITSMRTLDSYLRTYFAEDEDLQISPFDNPEEFMQVYAPGRYDLLVFDCIIRNTPVTGLDLLNDLRKRGEKAPAILVTTSVDFALGGYEANVRAYLVKPVTYGRLKVELDRLGLHEGLDRRMLCLPDSSEVDPTDISYARADGHYVVLREIDKGLGLRIRMSFQELEKALSPWEQFFRCTRGVLVNLDYVTDLSRQCFILQDGTSVPISRRLVSQAREALAWHSFYRLRDEGGRDLL